MIMSVPLQGFLVHRLTSRQSEAAKLTDKRVSFMQVVSASGRSRTQALGGRGVDLSPHPPQQLLSPS